MFRCIQVLPLTPFSCYLDVILPSSRSELQKLKAFSSLSLSLGAKSQLSYLRLSFLSFHPEATETKKRGGRSKQKTSRPGGLMLLLNFNVQTHHLARSFTSSCWQQTALELFCIMSLIVWLGWKKGIAFQEESMHLFWNYSVILIESQVQLRKYACVLSCVWLCSTPWSVAHQAPLSMGFPRQKYWNRLPFPSPGDLPNPGIKPASPVLASGFFTTELPGKPIICLNLCNRPAYGSENKIYCWRRELNVSK